MRRTIERRTRDCSNVYTRVENDNIYFHTHFTNTTSVDNEHPSDNPTIRQLTMTLPISLPTLQQMTMTLPLDSVDNFLESFLDVFLETPPLSPYECRSANEINGSSPRSFPHYFTQTSSRPRELQNSHINTI